ncbi:hypothetical protein Bpfe_020541 [Biomphalaria pfeifferi]|uniref:Uncharacterized protein n=1 Tax=Biomphalaria pfeifferi TaxID=112525 RepID=A0AAD8B8F5_BIOPF|nr:hypothetical protein Bpfe_020541 [Biomphalaria pfeifferi]
MIAPAFLLTIVLLYSTCVHGFFFSSEPEKKWNALKTTWGANPFSSDNFVEMPRTEEKAIKEGFVKISGCNESSAFRGSRYVKSGDYAVVLLFDANGYIAGIQTGVSNHLGNGFPSSNMRPLFSEDRDQLFLTAYFVEPSLICTKGRSASEFQLQGTGSNLYFQKGSDPAELILMPRNESALPGTKWGDGKCFITMGKHYWYDFRIDTSCTDYFPMFLMYNDGMLNAFGWALAAELTSRRYEHPPKSLLSLFIDTVPRCLYDLDHMSTMHIFLTDKIRKNQC